MLEKVLFSYGIDYSLCNISIIGNGLINNTWEITYLDKKYIVQRVNNNVFTNPEYIDKNVLLLTSYFKKNFPEYFFASPIRTLHGETMICMNGTDYFRLFQFVKGSKTYLATENLKQAYEAAKQFGKFTNLLSNIRIDDFNIIIPDFHNLSLRFEQFQRAILTATMDRRDNAKMSISFLLDQVSLVHQYENIIKIGILKKRITHYDTKISNVLFDRHDGGICVIDLDTVMPGYFISDFGDMVRTYVSPVTEEEPDLRKVFVREDYFRAIVSGYLGQMRNELSEGEINYFVYAGKFMVYMQALRFLTDYLNNDIYYGAKYKTHNLVRANNQIALLKDITEKAQLLQDIVCDVFRDDIKMDKAILN